ncbi:MAG: hypothetical protein A2265_00665, partial [Bacteroidetes bacterium RIFOXYA12_FULL_33_9]
AINLYKQAYLKVKENSKKAEVIYKTGLCYRKINDAPQAEVWFKKAVKVKYTNPLANLYFADALKQNEKYDEALIAYQDYLKLVPSDVRGKNGVESCELASKWKNKPSRYEVENMAFFNSRESDFSTTYAKKDYSIVIFTSTRMASAGTEVSGATGQSFADLYTATEDKKGKWSVPIPLTENVNSGHEEGTPSIASKGNNLFFTRCLVEKKVMNTCQIYSSVRKGVDWDVPVYLPIISDSVEAVHPSISEDELTLYFASSDIPGGQGGKDIWMISRPTAKDVWGAPINMGKEINTPGNEAFPNIREDGTLYFASDGHIGMGGLDIFKATKGKTDKWLVENMKYPINSASDDFGIVFEGAIEKGFFSSNRMGGKGMDDIYSFILRPIQFNLLGVVKNEKTGEILTGVTVKLIASDGVTQELKNEIDGSFKFRLKPNMDYVLTTIKEGFLNGKGKETTKGLDEDRDFNLTVTMAPIEKPIELENIMYDVKKWDLRPESMVSLDKLVEVLNDNPNVTIELRSHTDFRDEAAKNLELSQKRAQSVVDFLIERGIEPDRLIPKGYGESAPNIVNAKDAKSYVFLKEGDVLSEEYIKKLATVEEQEVAHQINRRTEFQVLRTDYKVAANPQTEETPKSDVQEREATPDVKTETTEPTPSETEGKVEEQ